jgi:rhodanese-related sulfurtransferase
MKKGGPGQLLTPFGITVMVLLAAVSVALWLAYIPWRWERTKEELRKRHPSVRRIDADGLKGWFAKPKEPKPVLIDVRPQADYDFSHLPGALHMALSDTPEPLGFPVKTGESLVVYDAVGEDSFAVASGLVQRGYARVQVLEGGIFEWANRGLPLEGASGATGTVQPGKSKFAGLLKRRATAQ